MKDKDRSGRLISTPDNKKNTNKEIKPLKGETPSQYADRLGVYYTSKVTEKHKKDLGQFFTPIEIAQFMASFGKMDNETIKILDPGCGVGILTAALAEVLAANSLLKNIELVAFETDSDILPLAENCFNYLSNWLNDRKITFTYFLCKNDFILHNSPVLNNIDQATESYDIVISNPPYFKLPKDDERAKVAKSVIHGQTNIYSIFLLLATKLLKNHGQLIFITPRSFCSGNYFRLFREQFFPMVNFKTIHLFNSRKDAFKRDKVLQENIIIAASKKNLTYDDAFLSALDPFEEIITISTSNGTDDLANRRIKRHYYIDLVNLTSYQKILHLPISDTDEEVIKIFKTWTGSLKTFNLEISTGPVVDFRSEEMISFKKRKSSVPLIWLHNVMSMKTIWPLNNGYKGKAKGQYINFDETSKSRLVENKNYVFLRRFSTKDEDRRLIASPYLKEVPEAAMIGIENHLNYIYHKKRVLTKIETIGIAALLNSKLFDIYFRTFNGNINVSATELRDFPLPSFEQIRALGERTLELQKTPSNNDIDLLVSKIFDLQIDLSEKYE